MKKNLFSVVIVLILICTLTPSAFASTAYTNEPIPENTTAASVASDPTWSWSILQSINYWQDPGYAINGVCAEDLGNGQEYLYVFFENGEVVGMNSLFVVNWLSHDAAYSWEATSNSQHIPLVSYTVGALLSGSDPWVTFSNASAHPVTLSPRIRVIPQPATTGRVKTCEIFADFLGHEVDVYETGTVVLELRLDDWFIMDCADVMRWQPREEEIEAIPNYIYVHEWGVRFQVPQNLVASYTFNSQTNTLVVTGITAKSLQYYPEFASFEANPDGLGALVYMPDYDPDNPPTVYGAIPVECDGKYFAYYHPQAMYSADPYEQAVEIQATQLIKDMMYEGIESF